MVDALREPLPPGGAVVGRVALEAERSALLRLAATEGLGPVAVRRAVEARGSGAEALRDPDGVAALSERRGEIASAARAAELLARWRDEGITCLCWHDPEYPVRLLHLHAPPPVLFVRGALSALARPGVAVVGSRDATAYGRRVAERLGGDLAAAGVAVLSGLARGVDGAAHRGALGGPGPTVAVVAGGVERASPRAHAGLYRRILDEGGAVVGEYLPGTRVQAFHFPVRNRILAALALGVVVVEATHRSGALITAARARELGREVLAVPGPVDRPTSRGTNALLRDGAVPALELRDVLEAVGLGALDHPAARGPELPSFPPGSPEARTWAALVEPGGADEVVRRVGLPAAQVLRALARLEIAGHVRREAGAAYRRRP